MFRRNLRQRVAALDGIVWLVFICRLGARCRRLGGDRPRRRLDAFRLGGCERRGRRGRARRHRRRRCRARVRRRGCRRGVGRRGCGWLHCRGGQRRGSDRRGYRLRQRRRGSGCHDWRGRGRRRRWRSRPGRGHGRIEQQGVLTHQPAGGPSHFQDHVNKRLLNRAVAPQTQIRPTVRPAQQFSGCAGQHIVVVDSRRTISVRRRHANP